MGYTFFGSMLVLATVFGVIADLTLFKWHKHIEVKSHLQSFILEASKSPLGLGLAFIVIEIVLNSIDYRFDEEFNEIAQLCYMFGYYFVILSLVFTFLTMILRHLGYFKFKDEIQNHRMNSKPTAD